MSEERRPFCRRHRSHFCPCLDPGLYTRGIPDALHEKTIRTATHTWDEAELEEQRKRAARTFR